MILDASVGVEVALSSPVGRRAIPLLADELIVPDLFYAEFHSVLHKLRLRKVIDAAQVREARSAVRRLGLLAMPVHHLEDELWKASQAISAYDAHYVVLARVMKMPVATCDARLAKSNSLGVRFLLIS